jgi:hypothetical protein
MTDERRVALEARAMTKAEVIRKALQKRITWLQAADILGLSSRHLYRLRLQYEQFGCPGLRDKRTGRRMPQRIPSTVIEELCRLKQTLYEDFSIRHFHQFATEKHGLKLSYTMTRTVLQARGLAEKAAARGKYRRKRERRSMCGMMLHLDASTHTWIPGLPQQDLMVMLDDADGRILYGRFWNQEGTLSTLDALRHVLVRYGRFCELYTDRGSHFCYTPKRGEDPIVAPNGQVARVLKTLGIRHILASSPEARGRSERAFGTIQGRLPQELRVAGITTYEGGNRYLDEVFVPDFNRRFTVVPAEAESAFVRLAGINLKLLLSVHHERVVNKDNTVEFGQLFLQLPRGCGDRTRSHYVRCPVLVHEFLDASLGVSYDGKLLATFDRHGVLVTPVPAQKSA